MGISQLCQGFFVFFIGCNHFGVLSALFFYCEQEKGKGFDPYLLLKLNISMKCPRCVQRMHRSATACPHCGCSMGDLDMLFGSEDVILKKFTDAAGVLRMKERESIRAVMEKFEKRFPQLFFSIYVAAFDEIPNLRQFGFWLLNRAAYSDVGVERPNENGILLVLDVSGKAAAISFGYAVMPYLDEDNTFDALSVAHPFLIQGEYLKAFKTIIHQAEATLIKGWRKAIRDPESFFAATGQAPCSDDRVLLSIRAGNQNLDSEENLSEAEVTQEK